MNKILGHIIAKIATYFASSHSLNEMDELLNSGGRLFKNVKITKGMLLFMTPLGPGQVELGGKKNNQGPLIINEDGLHGIVEADWGKIERVKKMDREIVFFLHKPRRKFFLSSSNFVLMFDNQDDAEKVYKIAQSK